MKNLLVLILAFAFGILNAQVSRTYENGAALFAKGDFLGSKIMMNKVIHQSKYYFEAYTIRGRAYEMLGMPDSALLDFNKALEIKAHFLPAIYFRGVLYFNRGQFNEAKADFDLILKAKADYINALIYRGRTFESLGNKEEAINDYTKAINLKLKNHEVYYRRGLLYEKANMPKDAFWDFDKSVFTKPDFVDGYLHRGIMNLALHKEEEALADFNKVISLTDTLEEAFQQRGDLNFKLKNYKLAAEDYSVIIDKFRRKDADLYYKRAESYFLDSNFSLANKEFSRVLLVKPRFDPAIVGQAKIKLIEQKPASAIPLLRKALAFNPSNGEAHFLMGKILFDQKKYIEAIESFNQSIKFLPTDEAYFYRGSCKFETSDKFGACLDLQEAVKKGYKAEGIEKMVQRVCN